MVGYPVWIGEAAGSSPVSYTKAVQALMGAYLTSNQEDRVRISSAAQRFVGVKANIPDCLSDDMGSPGSPGPYGPQKIVEWCNG